MTLYSWLKPVSALPWAASTSLGRAQGLDVGLLVHRQHGVLRRLQIDAIMSAAVTNAGSVLMHQLRRRSSEISYSRSTRQIWWRYRPMLANRCRSNAHNRPAAASGRSAAHLGVVVPRPLRGIGHSGQTVPAKPATLRRRACRNRPAVSVGQPVG
jgi:hypothetical protein